MRHDRRPHRRPKRTAPGAQNAQRAGQNKQSDSAPSGAQKPEAALSAIDEAQQAGKRAVKALLSGNAMASVVALNEAMLAMGAAAHSVQGLVR